MNLFGFHRERSEARAATAPTNGATAGPPPLPCADRTVGAADPLLSREHLQVIRLRIEKGTHDDLDVGALFDHIDAQQDALDEAHADAAAARTVMQGYADDLQSLRAERFDAQMARLLQKED